jgi:hypothetical protein
VSSQLHPAATRRRSSQAQSAENVALVDLLDRLLAGGVVLHGDITLAVADIDLVYVGLRALVSSVASADRHGVTLP